MSHVQTQEIPLYHNPNPNPTPTPTSNNNNMGNNIKCHSLPNTLSTHTQKRTQFISPARPFEQGFYPLTSCDMSQPNTVVSIIYIYSYTIPLDDFMDAIAGMSLEKWINNYCCSEEIKKKKKFRSFFLFDFTFKDALVSVPILGGKLKSKMTKSGRICGYGVEVDQNCGVNFTYERSNLTIECFENFTNIQSVGMSFILLKLN